ncbi:MAG: hypothetical protein ACLGHN_10070 [Bacteriovoracia bacterium]
MKYGFYLFLTIALIFGAYSMAQNKIKRPLNLSSVQLGMTVKDVTKTFGSPSAQTRNVLTYILHDGSELTITLRDKKVSSALVKFQRPAKIEDPEMKKLTLVQMDHDLGSNNQSWFFAGQPEEGLIYKITSEGFIESLTWVPPFSLGHNSPKNLQALLSDFRSQRSL